MAHDHHGGGGSLTDDSGDTSTISGTFFTMNRPPSLYLLYSPFPLSASYAIALAYVFILIVSVLERLLSHYHKQLHYRYPLLTSSSPGARDRDRTRWTFVKRLASYALIIFIHYHLMLIAMLFHFGLFIMIIASLVIGQALVEYLTIRHDTKEKQEEHVVGAGTPNVL